MIAAITFYSLVLFVHIAAVTVAFGVTFTYPLVVPLTRRTHPAHLAYLHRMQDVIGRRIISPLAILILLAGIYLALDGPHDFEQWWVGVGFGSILVLIALGHAFFSPRERRLAELAERDLRQGGGGGEALTPEYDSLARQVGLMGALSSLLVLGTIFVMVMGARGYL